MFSASSSLLKQGADDVYRPRINVWLEVVRY